MRYQKELLWTEGLFLQQHHLQYMQKFFLQRLRQERRAIFAFPCGLLDIDIDEEALDNLRLVVRRIAAV